MVDYQELMTILSVPRPNGSAAERDTCLALEGWLTQQGISHRVHTFRLYPFFFECIGVWLIVSRTLLALAIWLRWGWPALPIAIIGLIGGLLDVAFNIPVVSWPGARPGQNILIELDAPQAQQEVVFAAHYDSKTELLDHRTRFFFLRSLPAGIVLTLLLGIIGPLDRWLLTQGSAWAGLTFWLGVALSIALLFLAWGLGLNLSLGRLLKPSQGAVDNGAACAILLGLADRLARGDISTQHTRVAIALFTGEEVNMQGSRAYVRGRDWPLPAAVINLEIMAQDGDYVFWEQDGNVFKLMPTSPELNQALAEAVEETTGQPAKPAGPLNSDGGSFIFGGIPTGVLGTYDSQLKDGGFHQPSDNLGRVVMARLPEAVEILEALLHKYDQGDIGIHHS